MENVPKNRDRERTDAVLDWAWAEIVRLRTEVAMLTADR